MKLGQGSYEHFGSYRTLDFDFSNLGLCLVSGPTGSGKSTLFDAPAWCLFGTTGKDTAADDVRAWGAAEPTAAMQVVQLSPDVYITVTRVRGRGKNDLYWIENGSDGTPHRGKDLVDTQRLLEERLGVTQELYFSGAYFGQFSTADSFFMAKAKERREMFEQIADLTLPSRIDRRCGDDIKRHREKLESLSGLREKSSGRRLALEGQCDRVYDLWTNWDTDHDTRIEATKKKAETFEEDKKVKIKEANEKVSQSYSNLPRIEGVARRLQEIQETLQKLTDSTPCEVCGQLTSNKDKLLLLEEKDKLTALFTFFQRASDKVRQVESDFKRAADSENPYFTQVTAIEAEENPYTTQIEQLNLDLIAAENAEAVLEADLLVLNAKLSALDQIRDFALDLRGLLLENVVQEIQDATNGYLERYFDGEIQVTFALDADKLDIEIQKNGNTCSFKSLSGGQRCLLKLCFAISIMHAAANKAGQHFSQVFLDEPLHALDGGLKVKAFSLLQDLAQRHETVMVIEHSEEVKALFDTQYRVTLEGDCSSIEQL